MNEIRKIIREVISSWPTTGDDVNIGGNSFKVLADFPDLDGIFVTYVLAGWTFWLPKGNEKEFLGKISPSDKERDGLTPRISWFPQGDAFPKHKEAKMFFDETGEVPNLKNVARYLYLVKHRERQTINETDEEGKKIRMPIEGNIIRFPDIGDWAVRKYEKYKIPEVPGGEYEPLTYWTIFDDMNWYVGTLDEDGELTDMVYVDYFGPNYKEIETKVEGNFKDDPKQATRMLFLRRQKQRKLSESGMEIDKGHSYRVETRKLESPPGWVAYLSRDEDENGKFLKLRWNIYDERDELTATLYDDSGELYHNRLWDKGDFSEDKNIKFPGDVENAARYIFLKMQKPKKDILPEIRDMGEPQPVKIAQKVKLPELDGWTMERVKYDEGDIGKHDWIWEIFDNEGEGVGALMDDGSFNYFDKESEEWISSDINFKGNPKNAARYVFLKNSEIGHRYALNESAIVKTDDIPWITAFKSKAGWTLFFADYIISSVEKGKVRPNTVFSWKKPLKRVFGGNIEETIRNVWESLEKVSIPKMSKTIAVKNVHGAYWIYNLGDDKMTASLQPDGELFYETPFRDKEAKAEFNFKDDPINAIRFLYLKSSQKKMAKKNLVKEAYEPLEIGNEQKTVFSDIGNWSAIKKHDTVIAIYDDKNERVGTFKIRENHLEGLGILSYDVDPRGLGFGWQKSLEWKNDDIKNAVRFLFLQRQKKQLKKQLTEMEGDQTKFPDLDGYKIREMKMGHSNQYTGRIETYWNIYDSEGNNVGQVNEDGRLSYEEVNDTSLWTTVEMTFDPYNKESMKNAVRYVFLMMNKKKK